VAARCLSRAEGSPECGCICRYGVERTDLGAPHPTRSTATRNDLAAVVAVYRPASDVVLNVAAFAGQVDRVFAIDDSETPHAGVVAALRKNANLEYAPLGENLGIASTLSMGA